VHGGAGGVGTAAVQLGCATGATVTATVRDESNRGAAEQLGCTAIDPEGFADHGPFDVILELVGAPNMAANVSALRTHGRIVVIGISAGAKAEVNLALLMAKRARMMGSTLRARPLEDKCATARGVEHQVLPLVERGEVRVPIAETLPLDRVAEAYERFAAGGKLGKIVLVVD
jgi:NADPH2:quinone reductase